MATRTGYCMNCHKNASAECLKRHNVMLDDRIINYGYMDDHVEDKTNCSYEKDPTNFGYMDSRLDDQTNCGYKEDPTNCGYMDEVTNCGYMDSQVDNQTNSYYKVEDPTNCGYMDDKTKCGYTVETNCGYTDELTEENVFPVNSVEYLSAAGMHERHDVDEGEDSGMDLGIRGAIRTNLMGNLDTRLDRDKAVCNITGLAVLPNDRLALADYNNSRVKVMDTRRYVITSVLEVESRPWDVTDVCEGYIAVTLTDQQKIVFIHAGDLLVRGREIKVKGFCTGIAVYRNDKLVVSYVYPGKVEIIDMQGRVIRMFCFNMKGRELFSSPQYVTVCPFTMTIYVSDCLQHKVTQLRADGKIISTYMDAQLRSPEKVIVPKAGVVFVSGFASRNVHVLSESCQKMQVLPMDLRGSPCNLGYCEETGRLFVALSNKNYVVVYELS